jgi:hypothetical protein
MSLQKSASTIWLRCDSVHTYKCMAIFVCYTTVNSFPFNDCFMEGYKDYIVVSFLDLYLFEAFNSLHVQVAFLYSWLFYCWLCIWFVCWCVWQGHGCWNPRERLSWTSLDSVCKCNSKGEWWQQSKNGGRIALPLVFPYLLTSARSGACLPWSSCSGTTAVFTRQHASIDANDEHCYRSMTLIHWHQESKWLAIYWA